VTGRTTRTPARELRGAAENLRYELPPYFAGRARPVHEESSFVAICSDAHDGDAAGIACDGCHLIEVVHPVLAELIAGLLNARKPLAAVLDRHAEMAKNFVASSFMYSDVDGYIESTFPEVLAAARALLGMDGGESR
jgi:hypothetical protein